MENAMSYFNTKKNGSRTEQPTDTAQLTENLSVAVWKSEDEERRNRLHFRIARVNPRKRGATYSTLIPENVLELPACVATLATVFSRDALLPEEVRSELASLAREMISFLERKESNGPATEGSGNSRILNV
jgi:hypothetical protein